MKSLSLALVLALGWPGFGGEPAAPLRGDSPFGTNDFGIPWRVARVLGIRTADAMAREIRRSSLPMIRDLGIGWVRQHCNDLGSFGWSGVDPDRDGKALDFALTDTIVALAGANGLRVLPVLSPIPFDSEWRSAESYAPQDRAAYASYVRQVVERYDGDGADDMPGLAFPVKTWQLDNEPDLHHRFRKRRGDAGFCSPAEYLDVLRLTRDAMKTADPEARVMANVAGNGQGLGDFSFDYAEELRRLGAGDAYDVFSYHLYPASDRTAEMAATFQRFSEIAGERPLWITECGLNGRLGEEEREQASWLVKLHAFHLANGVRGIAWLTLDDMSPAVPEGAVGKYAGLAAFRGRVRKLSYHAYKKMAATLAGCDGTRSKVLQPEEGAFVCAFTRGGKRLWVAWSDEGARALRINADPMPKAVTATLAVPSDSDGRPTFGRVPTRLGLGLEVEVGGTPVYIEEN